MSNLPVTKDHFSDPAMGEVLWLGEKQVKQIEADARLKMSNALIAELSFAIDNYIIFSGKKIRTIPRSKIRRQFRTLKRNLDGIHLLLSASSPPEIKETRQKLESALWAVHSADREEHKKSSDKNDKPSVGLGRLQNDLVYLNRAVQTALDRLDREALAQKNSKISGSKKEAAFDQFLEDLDGIYRRATSVKGSFVDFLLAVHEAMPEKNRPRLPAGWGDKSKDRKKSRK